MPVAPRTVMHVENPTAMHTLSTAEVGRLKWRARRGLLECDLFVQRFFARHGATMTGAQAQGLTTLMALDDPALLDLLLARVEPDGDIDTIEVREVLSLMRVHGLN